MRKLHFLLLSISVIALSGCAVFNKSSKYDYLEDKNNNKIVISKHEPYSQFTCTSLGFLPCSLNSKTTTKENKTGYMQCAKNILPFATNIDANYFFIEEPIKTLGITWRDAKANLYNCQLLPLPQTRGNINSNLFQNN